MNIDEIAAGVVVMLVLIGVSGAIFGFVIGLGLGERREREKRGEAESEAWQRGHAQGREEAQSGVPAPRIVRS